MMRRTVIHWFGNNSRRNTPPPFDPADFSPALSTRMLVLQPTPFCNIDCDYCYLPQRSSTARMGLPTLRQAGERLRDDGLAAPQITVVWHAGEPLTVPPAWYEDAFGTLAQALPHGCALAHSIQTNAMLVDEAWCWLFLRHGVQVGVSVDGPPDLHDAHRRTRTGKGTHAQAMRGLAALRAHGIAFHAIAVVTPATFAAVERFADFFEGDRVTELGCNFDETEGGHARSSLAGHEAAHATFLARLLERSRWPGSTLRVRELASAMQLIAQPLPEVRWRGRRWPLNMQVLPFAMLNVAHDGRWSTFSPELLGQPAPAHGDFVFGDVHQAGYLHGAQGEAFRRVWDGIARGIERCERECAYFGYCGGGAPANKFYENGALDSGETLYCRSMVKRPFDVVLGALEASGHSGQSSFKRVEAKSV
jgi:uncharacterized protein